jgi:hypothetical protein
MTHGVVQANEVWEGQCPQIKIGTGRCLGRPYTEIGC